MTRTSTVTATATPCECITDVVLTQYLTVVGQSVTATFHNNSITCSHLVGIASYERVDNNIEHQFSMTGRKRPSRLVGRSLLQWIYPTVRGRPTHSAARISRASRAASAMVLA